MQISIKFRYDSTPEGKKFPHCGACGFPVVLLPIFPLKISCKIFMGLVGFILEFHVLLLRYFPPAFPVVRHHRSQQASHGLFVLVPYY